MNETLYNHRYHGKIVRTENGRVASASTLACERIRVAEFNRRAALLGKVIAGWTDGKAWIGTATKLLKKNNGTLVVVTRSGNKFQAIGGEETTFEKWDAQVTQAIQFGELTINQILL